jgi:hypothetical protein
MLDTHAAVKDLMRAGFDEPKAEAIVQAQLKLMTQGLVTKAGLIGSNSELKDDIGALDSKIGSVRSELKDDIAMLRLEMEKRFGTLHGWIVAIFVLILLTNPLAARLIERVVSLAAGG